MLWLDLDFIFFGLNGFHMPLILLAGQAKSQIEGTLLGLGLTEDFLHRCPALLFCLLHILLFLVLLTSLTP